MRVHMKPNFKFFSEMTTEEFAEWASEVDARYTTWAVFIGDDMLIRHNGQWLELDIGKYDKCQHILAHEFRRKLYTRFGMPANLALLYYHITTVASIYSRDADLKARIEYEMLSGMPDTLLGNSTFQAAAILTELPLTDEFAEWLVTDLDCERMAATYNLEMKPYSYKYPYFASRFCVPVEGHIVVMPDPLKIVVGLGRHDVTNEKHRDEIRSAVLDQLRPFNDDLAVHYLATALKERYKLDYHPYDTLVQLYITVNHAPSFNQLFYAAPNARINRSTMLFAK